MNSMMLRTMRQVTPSLDDKGLLRRIPSQFWSVEDPNRASRRRNKVGATLLRHRFMMLRRKPTTTSWLSPTPSRQMQDIVSCSTAVTASPRQRNDRFRADMSRRLGLRFVVDLPSEIGREEAGYSCVGNMCCKYSVS